MDYVAKKENSQDQEYTCPVCDRVFGSRQALNAHMRMH